MRTSLPLIFESYEKEKKVKEDNGKEQLNNPKKVIPQAPAMNSDKETEKLLKTYKKNRIKWDENENNNYTFLSNLEEIVYYNPPPIILKKKIIKNDKWDKYMDLFEP